jgi:HEAT repeat protein
MPDNDTSPQTLIDAMLREADPTRQSKLIEALGEQRLTEAVEPLMQQVTLNAFQSGAAITALGKIGDPRAVGVLIRSCRYQNLAWIAKDALVQIGAPAVEPLIDALQSDHPDVRFMAVRVLGELGDPRAVAPLESLITTEPDETNRQLARSTLKGLLLDGLTDPDPAVRELAVGGLDRLGDARTIEPLQSLADRDPALCEMAQAVIVRLLRRVERNPFAAHDLPPRSRDTNLLINRVQRAAGVRIAEAADLSGTATALQDIARNQTDPALRDMAQQALRQLCLESLRLPRAETRLIAVQTLGTFDDPAAARLLHQIADHDPDETVRQAARAAARS